MKIKIIAASLLIFSISSCKKSFLSLPSQTTLSTPVFFKTQTDFVQAINGAYAPLRTLYNGIAGSTGSAWVMGEMHSDNTRYIINPNYRATIDQENTADFIYDPSSAIATAAYTTNYLVIARANQVLAPIDAVDFDATVKNNIKGQAYFLRALCYFNLVQYFGKVPLHLKPAGSLGETALAPSSIDSVYAQIISDASQAASLLLDKASQEAGRATLGAAQTLLANVLMVQKKWADAETQLRAVVASGKYSLVPDYAAVFDPANKNNSESVFEIQYKEGTEGYASNFIYQFLPLMSAASVSAITGVAGEQALTAETYNTPSPDILAAYEPGDKRKDASIGYAVGINGITYPFIKKYLHPHTLPGISNDNWPVYRYSEVLLLLAEALNEQNKSAEALTYLNQVRTRAGLANSSASGQSDIRDAIANERRVELAFENKRWLDLVRTGQANAVISAYGARIKANPQNYYFPVGYAPVPAAFGNISLLFPYPSSEVALNPLLK
jgi:hypothetical protein